MPIRFVKMDDSGRFLPVNPRPGTTGSVCAHLVGGQLRGYVMRRDRPPHATHPLRFTPHAATCEARQPATPAPPLF